MSVIVPQKSEQGWIIELPDDFTELIGAEPESIGVLQIRDGKIEIEVLPPPTQRIRDISERIAEKYKSVVR